MTHGVLRWAAAAAVPALLAALSLQAAEQPENVPTYSGQKPAGKPLPTNVPVYRPQPDSTKLVRRQLNAPRPGVAMPAPAKPAKESKNKAQVKQPKAQDAWRGDAG